MTATLTIILNIHSNKICLKREYTGASKSAYPTSDAEALSIKRCR